LEDEWFRAELKRHAQFIVRSHGESCQWLGDVVDEAILSFAAKLEKAPNLGLDSAGRGEKFPHIIGTIARNECIDALVRLSRNQGTESELLQDAERAASIRFHETWEELQDLATVIDELPEPERSVLRYYQARYRLREIPQLVQLTYWETYAAFRRGVARICDEFR